jgi:prevent-host-death family protein
MKAVNIRQARQRLSELVDQVERGEEVVLTRRGQAVARLAPAERVTRRLPSLKDFRAGIGGRGTPSVRFLRQERNAR